MKTIYIYFFITVLAFFTCDPISAQVAISNDGSNPDPNAMLEIKSGSKGLLLPRIDYNNRPASPLSGLILYVTANGPYGKGLYMGTGTDWVKLLVTYTIGQEAGGGIVYYVDSSGMHGLISASFDQGYEPWGCDSTLIGPSAQHLELGEGDLNTAAIVAVCPQSAALICDTSTLGGYTDWYLPSKFEQDSMFYHRNEIGGFVEDQWYWSSTEADATEAVMKINNPAWIPSWTSCSKSYFLSVRCIRKF